jgi:hypothetical protein
MLAILKTAKVFVLRWNIKVLSVNPFKTSRLEMIVEE